MYTLSQLIDRYLRYCAVHRRPRTTDYYRHQLKKLLGAIGDLPTDQINAETLLYLPRSWHLIQAAQRLFRWACREAKLIPSSPIGELTKPAPGMRRRILSRKEVLSLMRATSAVFRRFLLGLRETAARPQELRAVEWEDLQHHDTDGDVQTCLRSGAAWFELTDYKARDRRADRQTTRVIPISARLGRSLCRALRTAVVPRGPVFLDAMGKAWRKNTVVCAMRRLRRRVGLAMKPRTGGEQVCCYTLRHTTATNLAGEGLPTHLLQTFLGHAQVTTTARYVHLSKRALLDAWRRFATRPLREDRPDSGSEDFTSRK